MSCTVMYLGSSGENVDDKVALQSISSCKLFIKLGCQYATIEVSVYRKTCSKHCFLSGLLRK